MLPRVLKGARGVVAGATGTVGEVIGRELAGRGCELLAVGHSVERFVRSQDWAVQTCAWDCTAPKGAADLLERELAAFCSGGQALHFAINCTGAGGWWETAEMPLEHWNLLLQVNLTSAFLLTRAVLPHMSGIGGVVVHVSSDAAHRCKPFSAAYSGCKAGLEAFARSVDREVTPQGIRVYCRTPRQHIRGRFVENALARSGLAPRLVREDSSRELDSVALQMFADSIISLLERNFSVLKPET
jgi:NAD(P)-dependent dehydrogenase (short-subunit alcohol dehydrogenase family)